MTDAEIIRQFTSLYERHQRQIHAYAVTRAGGTLAEEVVAETFLIAWRRLDALPRGEPASQPRGEQTSQPRGEPASQPRGEPAAQSRGEQTPWPRDEPLPWLLATARNVIRERYRAEERQRLLAVEMSAWVEEAGPPDIADEVTDRAAILAALARLPEDDRELLTLVAWHGLTPRSAAQVIGCSTATYFVRLHRARRRLTAALAAAEKEPPPHRPAGLAAAETKPPPHRPAGLAAAETKPPPRRRGNAAAEKELTAHRPAARAVAETEPPARRAAAFIAEETR